MQISSAARWRGSRPSRWPSYQGHGTDPRSSTGDRAVGDGLVSPRVVLGATTATAWPRSLSPPASSLVTVGTPPTMGAYWSETIMTRSFPASVAPLTGGLRGPAGTCRCPGGIAPTGVISAAGARPGACAHHDALHVHRT